MESNLRNVQVPLQRAHLQTVRLNEVAPVPIRWLWEPRIALGKVSLLSGDPGRGKSLVSIAMAATVSRGFEWPVDGATAPRGAVLMLSAEDNIADTIRPRLDAAAADVSRIHCATFVYDRDQKRRSFSLQSDVELLARKLEELGDCKLVVIDPVSAFTGTTDTHKNSDVRVLLFALSEIAQQFDVAILAISHLNKGSSNAMYRTMGSLAFVAAARSVYAVVDDPNDQRRRFVLPIKNNLASDIQGLAYRIEESANGVPVIAWEAAGVIDEINAVLNAEPQEQRSELSQAIEWLTSELSGGPVNTKTLIKTSAAAGHSWRTVRRAQSKLGVTSKKTGTGGGWQWWHPDDL